MSFSLGFIKIAAFGHNNQGLEFKEFDTGTPSAPGPGGMSPSGIETYQPLEEQKPQKTKKGRRADPSEVARLVVEKLSQASGDSYNTPGTGSSMQTASTVATQLKYDRSTPWSHESVGDGFADKPGRFQKQKRSGNK